MDHVSNSKAGPSQVQPRYFPEKSGWRGQVGSLMKALSIVAVMLLTYAVLREMFLDKKRQVWVWKFHDKTAQNGSSKGSQYLLGVGKADITG